MSCPDCEGVGGHDCERMAETTPARAGYALGAALNLVPLAVTVAIPDPQHGGGMQLELDALCALVRDVIVEKLGIAGVDVISVEVAS